MAMTHVPGRLAQLALFAAALLAGGVQMPGELSNHGAEHRLPLSLPPEIWTWNTGSPGSDAYKASLDMIADQSNFGFLTTKSPRDVTTPEAHAHVKRVVEYAHSRGIRLAVDLDVRRARLAFQKLHPDQQQWMLRIRSFPLKGSDPIRVEIASSRLSDHTGEQALLSGRLVRVWRATGPRKNLASDLEELKSGVRVVEESKERIVVEVSSDAEEVIVAAAFEYRTPDVFSPALIPFQKQILEQYRDTGMDGAMKDEWGFPPVYNHGAKDGDFWYSDNIAAAYAKAGGGEFVRDCVLMTLGIGGARDKRLTAVNRYMRLVLTENGRIEDSFYRETKRQFGSGAFVVVHATWGHMPFGDAFKNGYSWWQATRDYGQTDEQWPLPIRTSLAKKMGGPVWYNQFHERRYPESIYWEIWRDARAGGRVNFLTPRWLLEDKAAMRAESRVRLLNYVSKTPLDCPVAVVFGHAAAVNWVGPHFGDLGVDFAEDLWARGVRADVIPSTEIQTGALKIDPDGMVSFGVQKYQALVFLNPEYEPDSSIDFLRKVSRSNSQLFIRGHRTLTFDGVPRSESDTLVDGAGSDPTPSRVVQFLTKSHSAPMAPYRVEVAPLADQSMLTDGTTFLARGEQNPAGDPIDATFYCGTFRVKAKATGVFAIKLSKNGDLESLAASDLRFVEAGNFRLELTEPVDLALWRENGRLRGVIQGISVPPPALLALTHDWALLQNVQPK
ncbi:MAG: hypothetical protein HS122_12590 [Opitutaceae bacterium]|nr:hypothetical protein [Opitutaceae bacterium]